MNSDFFLKNYKIGTMKSRINNMCLSLIRNDQITGGLPEITTDEKFTFKIL